MQLSLEKLSLPNLVYDIFFIIPFCLKLTLFTKILYKNFISDFLLISDPCVSENLVPEISMPCSVQKVIIVDMPKVNQFLNVLVSN